jgi:3-deoxy-D-manno-octulosonate 8-phosphate phosphatase (KDO 8-P phosphatase)
MKLLKASGVDMAIITGRTSKVVTQRAESTGVTYIYQGVDDKLLAFEELLQKTGLQAEQCAFMGDDVVDLPPMRRAGLALTIPQAHSLVKQHSHYMTKLQAGNGAVREVCEFIMRAQGTLDGQLAQFLR